MGVVFFQRGRSSPGRAPRSQRGGSRFESDRLHHFVELEYGVEDRQMYQIRWLLV